MSMFERYTEAARKTIFFARYEASQCGCAYIEPEHLLLGILRADPDLVARLLLTPAKIDAIRERALKDYPVRKKISTSVDMPLSAACKTILEHAADEAKKLDHKQIRPEHLLLGLCAEKSGLVPGILHKNDITAASLRRDAMLAEAERPAATLQPPPPEPKSRAAVNVRDLTEAARKGEIGPLVGRDRELERVIHILSRRTKNNCVLIGEAGIGKTAIVEGLAHRIAAADTQPALAGRSLIAMDVSVLLAAGARSRSAWLSDALGEIADSAAVILFIRGLFNLAAGGSGWPAVEAMHALEPFLARGAIQCIATGSPQGLRETFEKAGALARQFEIVEVAPVSEEDAIGIVHSLKERFEKFHGVTFSGDAIEKAVYASGRVLPDRHLPDRAIDLIDEAAVAVRLHREGPDKTVMPDDIEAAAAARLGVSLAEVRSLLKQKDARELQRITAELLTAVPVEAREWVAFLAAYLARCSPAEAEKLARAIVSAKGRPNSTQF